MLNLTYIYHSSFLLTVEGKYSILFDYWKSDEDDNGKSMPEEVARLDADLPLYILVSHHHKDHYNPHIFGWGAKFKNIHFIVSNDTARFARHLLLGKDRRTPGPKIEPDKISVLKPGESFHDDLIQVRAFGSTDIGNSYMLSLTSTGSTGFTAFHAGDFNDWIWLDESTDEEVRQMEGRFLSILNNIKDLFPRIDLCMFPVDSRIGREYWRGAKMMVENIDIATFVPMHFCHSASRQQNLTEALHAFCFSLYANPRRGQYMGMRARGDSWCTSI